MWTNVAPEKMIKVGRARGGGATIHRVMNMLSTDFSPILAGFVVFNVAIAIIAFYQLRKLAIYCRDAVEFVQMQNKNAVSLRRMAEVEATLTDLQDSYISLLDSHKKLRSRITMRMKREVDAARDAGGVPDPKSDPDGFKREMRLRLLQK